MKFSAPECDNGHAVHAYEKRAIDMDEDVEMNCEGKFFLVAQKCILWFIPRRNEGIMTCLFFNLIETCSLSLELSVWQMKKDIFLLKFKQWCDGE